MEKERDAAGDPRLNLVEVVTPENKCVRVWSVLSRWPACVRSYPRPQGSRLLELMVFISRVCFKSENHLRSGEITFYF